MINFIHNNVQNGIHSLLLMSKENTTHSKASHKTEDCFKPTSEADVLKIIMASTSKSI